MSVLLAQLLQQFEKSLRNLLGHILFIYPPQILVDLLLDRLAPAVISLWCHTFVNPGNLVRTGCNL